MQQAGAQKLGKSRLGLAGAFLCMALIGLMMCVHYIGGSQGDKDWLLLAARLWLNGKRLYVDIFEVNPPLIVWLYAVPVYLSGLSGMEDYHLLVLLMLLLCCLSALLCGAVIRYYPAFAGQQAVVVLMALCVLIPWANPSYFADREQIFITLVLPYALRFMPGLAERNLPFGLRLAVGVMAGVGFCIKPHCLLVLVAIQVFHLVRLSSLRMAFGLETLLVGVCIAIYIAAAWVFVPDYFNTVLPIALATYGKYKNGPDQIMLYIPPLLTLGVALAEFRPSASARSIDVYYWLALTLAALLYAVANNGWLYSFYPLHAFVLVSVCWLLWEFSRCRAEALAQAKSTARFTSGLVACVVVIGFNMATIFPYAAVFMNLPAGKPSVAAQCVHEMGSLIRKERLRSFGAISLSAAVWPGLARSTGARFEMRFHNLWMMPKFLDAQPAPEHRWVLEYVAHSLAADLAINKPDVVFLEQATAGRHWQLLPFFSNYSDFSEVWSRYTPVVAVEGANKEGGNADAPNCNYVAYRRF